MFNHRIDSVVCSDSAKRHKLFDVTIQKRIDNWWRHESKKRIENMPTTGDVNEEVDTPKASANRSNSFDNE